MRLDKTGHFLDSRDRPCLARSDGRRLLLASWVIALIATFLLMTGIRLPEMDYVGEETVQYSQEKVAFILAAAGGFSLSFALLITGWIVRAIYFLPGDMIKPCAETAMIAAKSEGAIVSEATDNP